MALVYYHFDPRGKSEDAKRATLITTTLLVVLFSILVCGALTKPLLQLLLEPQGTLPLACLAEMLVCCTARAIVGRQGPHRASAAAAAGAPG